MTQAPDLPAIHEAVLDAETFCDLIEDVRQCTRVVEVIIKQQGQPYASDRLFSLDDAKQMMEDGTATGIQLRYCYDGSQWFDTLVRTEACIRLVRIRHD